MSHTKYYAKPAKFKLNAVELDFVKRRIEPFINAIGLQTRTIEQLLIEAYLQGMRDALCATSQ